MSQNDAKNDTCPACKQVWLTHHTLKGVNANGRIDIACHSEALAETDFVLKYVLDNRAAKLDLKAQLEKIEQDAALEKQQLLSKEKLKYDARLKSDVAAAVEVEAAKRAEETRLSLAGTHEALMKDLKDQLKESERTSEILLSEKDKVVEELAESRQKAIDLELKLDEVEAVLEQTRQHHRRFREKTVTLVAIVSTLGKRIAMLEQKLGIADKEEIRRLYKEHTGEDIPEGVLDTVIPTRDAAPAEAIPAPIAARPVPAPAPKPAPPPVQMAAKGVSLDDPMAAPAAPASAGAQDADDDQAVDDSQVISLHADDSEDDSEDDERAECTIEGCDDHATEAVTFIAKDGSEKRWFACNPSKHAETFLKHMQKAAKSPPKTATDVIVLFTPIQ